MTTHDLDAGQPIWRQRAALRAITDLPPAESQALLDDLVGRDHLHELAEYQFLVGRLALAMMRDGRTSRALWKAGKALVANERAAIADQLDRSTLIAVAQAMLAVEEGIEWMDELLPRYLSVVDVPTALQYAIAENRPFVYASGGPDLIARVLRDDIALVSWWSALFKRFPDDTAAELATAPIDCVFAVAHGTRFGSAQTFVAAALGAAARVVTDDTVDREIGGICVHACATALELGDVAAARTLYARFERAAKPVTFEREEVDSFYYDDLPGQLARDREAERRDALARFEEHPDGDRATLEHIVGAKVEHTYAIGAGWITIDARQYVTFVSRSDVSVLGRMRRDDEWHALGDITSLADLGEGVLLARTGSDLVLIDGKTTRIVALSGDDPLDRGGVNLERYTILDDPTLRAEVDGDTLVVTRASTANLPRPTRVDWRSDAARSLMQLITDELRAGRELRLEERTPPALSVLRDIDPTAWLGIPQTLTAMGFPAGAIAVAVRLVTDADIDELDPSLVDDELVRIWRAAGAPALTCGGFELHFATPAELAASTFQPDNELAGTFRVAARFANNVPAILLQVDDGAIEPRASRYACKRDGAWDGGWELLTLLCNMLEKPIEKRLVSFIGKQAFAAARLGDRITLRPPPKPVERHDTVADAWRAFAKWRKANDIDVSFNRAAAKKALEKLAKKFPGLPTAVRDSLARHDGDDESYGFAGWSMMGVADIEREHTFWTTEFETDAPPPADDPRLPETWWDNHWVPFVSSGGGDFLAIDTSNQGEGRVVLALSDPPMRKVIAPSFEHFFLDFVHALESGSLEWDSFGEWLHGD